MQYDVKLNGSDIQYNDRQQSVAFQKFSVAKKQGLKDGISIVTV